MVIKYHISPYPNLLEPMVARIYEAQSPDAVIWEQVLPGPHTTPKTIVANGLDKVVHIVRLFTQNTANKLHEYNLEPTEDTVNVFDPIRFRIGDAQPGTPGAYLSNYQNALLLGLDVNDYLVYRNGQGYLIPGRHYQNEPVAGGFTLIGDAFSETDEFIIQRKPKSITTVVNDSVVGKMFGGFVDISNFLSYLPAHLRKLFRFKSQTAYSFEAGAAIPIGYGFCFSNQQSGNTGTVNFANAPLLYNSGAVSTIQLPPRTEACFVFDGTNWNVVYFTTRTEDGELEIIAKGINYVGDVFQRDQVITVDHFLGIQGNYIVLYSILCNEPNNHAASNTMGHCWFHSTTDKGNQFKISFQEINSEVQNISVAWAILKM